jgi:hypothetical protein
MMYQLFQSVHNEGRSLCEDVTSTVVDLHTKAGGPSPGRPLVVA